MITASTKEDSSANEEVRNRFNCGFSEDLQALVCFYVRPSVLSKF